MCRAGCSCRSTALRNPPVLISVLFSLIYIMTYLFTVWLVYVAFVHCTSHTAYIYAVLFNFEPSRLGRFFNIQSRGGWCVCRQAHNVQPVDILGNGQ